MGLWRRHQWNKVINVSFIEAQCKKGIHTGVVYVCRSIVGQTLNDTGICLECNKQVTGAVVSLKEMWEIIRQAKAQGFIGGVFIDIKQNPVTGLTKKDDKTWQS